MGQTGILTEKELELEDSEKTGQPGTSPGTVAHSQNRENDHDDDRQQRLSSRLDPDPARSKVACRPGKQSGHWTERPKVSPQSASG